jgi:SAM-dependent methyltransferase
MMGSKVITRAGLAVAMAAAAVVAHVVLHAQRASLTSEVSRLVELLELRSDSVVADLGAGLRRGQRRDGQAARTHEPRIRHRHQCTAYRGSQAGRAKAGLTNIVALEGAPGTTNLPEACCDALFVRDVYHHFADPAAMNASILRSLKPGGRFAVMDGPRKREDRRPTPERPSGDTHGVARETVLEELKTAGFEIVTVLAEWPSNLFLVLARKPAR